MEQTKYNLILKLRLEVGTSVQNFRLVQEGRTDGVQAWRTAVNRWLRRPHVLALGAFALSQCLDAGQAMAQCTSSPPPAGTFSPTLNGGSFGEGGSALGLNFRGLDGCPGANGQNT